MTRLFHLLRDDWRKNYRYHGGMAALTRCWHGHRALRRGRVTPEPTVATRMDCTVFSVVPEMTALWAVMFERAVRPGSLRVLIGDCSGGLGGGTETCRVVPMLNVHHGEKLDLFFAHLCRAELVLVTDDDIFWLDDAPLRWAVGRLAAEPDVAVVSVAPKPQLSSVLRGKVDRAMGSVLIIRRSIWEREELSFRVVHPPPSEGVGWHYDTGEFAQVTLTQRGRRIDFAPPELRNHLVAFEGVSSWTLKIQKYSGDLRAAIESVPIRQEKALQTVFVLRGMAELIDELKGEQLPRDLVQAVMLDRAQSVCEELLDAARVRQIQGRVSEMLARIRRRLFDLEEIAPIGEDLRRMLGR